MCYFSDINGVFSNLKQKQITMRNQVGLVTGCLLLFCCVSITVQNTVKVSVYYECLCPDCVAFICDQLVPTYKKLENKIEIDLVPYGKAEQTQHEGHWTFTCQHGPKECEGNKLHACLVNFLYPKWSNKLVRVIGCLMGHRDHFEALPQCAKKEKLNPDDFIKCARSTEGENLLAKYGNRTHNFTPKIRYIPTITFNDIYNEEDSRNAENDLESVVRKYLPDI